MSKIEKLEKDVQGLSSEDLAKFRAWLLEFDWAAWDRQIERDVAGGKLDSLGDRALREHSAGRTKVL